jgi:hypothetical protein
LQEVWFLKIFKLLNQGGNVMSYQRRKSPVISGILSFFFPGAGQLYNEDFLKGIILIAATIAAIVSIVFTGISMGSRMYNGSDIFPQATQIVTIVTAALILFGIWLYGMIDAVIFAQKTNVYVAANASAANSDTAPRSKEGMIGLGIVLLVIGLAGIMLQLGLRFDLLIRYGGPTAIILVGVYLVLRTSGLLKGGK